MEGQPKKKKKAGKQSSDYHLERAKGKASLCHYSKLRPASGQCVILASRCPEESSEARDVEKDNQSNQGSEAPNLHEKCKKMGTQLGGGGGCNQELQKQLGIALNSEIQNS